MWALATGLQNLTSIKIKQGALKEKKKKIKSMCTSRTRFLKNKIIHVRVSNFQKVCTCFFAAKLMNLRTFLRPLINEAFLCGLPDQYKLAKVYFVEKIKLIFRGSGYT